METDIKRLRWDPDTCGCKLEVLKFEQGIDGLTRVYNAAGKLREETPHAGRVPGVRLRARVREACVAHVTFTDILQTQRRRCPAVCACSWLEIRAGDAKEKGLFGTVVESKCQAHAHVDSASIPALIETLAK